MARVSAGGGYLNASRRESASLHACSRPFGGSAGSADSLLCLNTTLKGRCTASLPETTRTTMNELNAFTAPTICRIASSLPGGNAAPMGDGDRSGKHDDSAAVVLGTVGLVAGLAGLGLGFLAYRRAGRAAA